MMRALWVAKTGLEGQQTRLDVVANNLANVGTNGFKKQRAIFEDLMYQQVVAPGALSSQQTTIPAGLQLGAGVRPVSNAREFTQGALQQVGSGFSVGIKGNGFFQILTPDGTTAYSRDGNFEKDAEGNLVNASGYQLQPAITIPNNATEVVIGKDGTVSAKIPGQVAMAQLGQITLTNFVNPAGLMAMGDNLFVETPASGAPQEGVAGTEGLGSILQGFVENSNVNVAEELVVMIETQRAYELNSKAITTADQMLARLSQIS